MQLPFEETAKFVLQSVQIPFKQEAQFIGHLAQTPFRSSSPASQLVQLVMFVGKQLEQVVAHLLHFEESEGFTTKPLAH